MLSIRIGLRAGPKPRSSFPPAFAFALALSAVGVAFGDENVSKASSPRAVEFARDVLPIIAKRCIGCHGGGKAKGGLRLDSRAAVLRGGDGGAAAVPGSSGESRLVELVSGSDPELVMPPEGERLTTREIEVLRRWIDGGLEWPAGVTIAQTSDHWAFQPIADPSPPRVKRAEWIRNSIDAFVLAQLERRAIEPSPEADRTTLLRRLSLDLTGLPPSPAEVASFLADRAAGAYERAVDRLLESPHFGEHWGRHWLDLARYADSDGYEKDRPRPFAWRYRNWVIRAINEDLPFDRFSLEQLAGDLLPGATTEQLVATGFHRNTLTNTEGGTDQEEFRVKATVDRANTTASVWLGLTFGCAQCHSHKYDPITQHEYYRLFAFFNSIDETTTPAALEEEAKAYRAAKASFDLEDAKLVAAVASVDRDGLAARQREWEGTLADLVSWTPLEVTVASSTEGATLATLDDGSILASGERPESDTYLLEGKADLRALHALRVHALPHESLGAKGPGRTEHGNFVLSEVELEIADGDAAKAKPIKLAAASAEHSQNRWPVTATIDGKPETGWGIAPHYGRRHSATFELAEPVELSPGARVRLRLKQVHGSQHTIGRFRVDLSAAPQNGRADSIPDDILRIARVAREERGESDANRIRGFYRDLDPAVRERQAALNAHRKLEPAAPKTIARTVRERTPRRTTRILARGDFLRPGAEVGPGTPEVLHAFSPRASSPDRIDLVHWLFDPANPLTARVAANRVWQHLFGEGLVRTPEDFGTRGETPTHPALLDWLANEYRRLGWSRKELIRLIVCSATYRQASNVRPELESIDPRNRLLARQNRFRLAAETVRDLFLGSSDLLVRKIGGPSVRPPLPEGVRELGYANSVKWDVASGGDRYRRGLYIFFQRTVPFPMLSTFDAPDSNTTCLRRRRSNTPLQALTLLNDPVLFEGAQALGRRIAATPDESASDRARMLFMSVVSREPDDVERGALLELYEEARASFRRDAEAARTFAGLEAGVAAGRAIEAAAWVTVARVVFNLDEAVTRG